MTRQKRKPKEAKTEPETLVSKVREQHDRITVAEKQIVDALGGIGLPYVVEGPLQRLYRQGEITDAELDAALEFRRLYRLGFTDPLRAASFDERIVAGGDRLPHASDYARRRVNAILKALGSASGSLMASCADHVIGSEASISEWARSRRWSGRNLNDHVAKGILIATLQMLPDLVERRPEKV